MNVPPITQSTRESLDTLVVGMGRTYFWSCCQRARGASLRWVEHANGVRTHSAKIAVHGAVTHSSRCDGTVSILVLYPNYEKPLVAISDIGKMNGTEDKLLRRFRAEEEEAGR